MASEVLRWVAVVEQIEDGSQILILFYWDVASGSAESFLGESCGRYILRSRTSACSRRSGDTETWQAHPFLYVVSGIERGTGGRKVLKKSHTIRD